jgi:hypothetical protein
MAIYKNAPKFVDRDELKSLWRMLRRLQGDVLLRNDGLGWNWTPRAFRGPTRDRRLKRAILIRRNTDFVGGQNSINFTVQQTGYVLRLRSG